eukprot:CAMPEP_0198119364 /NCGR_PEP_ID=MMETSP1442-20131203/25329_1 /TAXON_ID= /ORGANISM="Craspedostauros australis, Strain CCMP3328" /LENGTH=159 /DNA_ID=CAMNT_0043777815 /DNA_START=1 /DNA_END=480 /DNA_ORIENTATION=-
MLNRCQPTIVTYNLVLACLASIGSGEKAQALLQYMDKRKGRRRGVAPGLVSYNTVLNAWANQGGAEAIVRAEYLIREEMKEVGLKPDKWTYGTWLKCLANSSLTKEGVEIPVEPSASTRSLVPSLEQRAQEVLEEMKQAGLEPTDRDLEFAKQCNVDVV